MYGGQVCCRAYCCRACTHSMRLGMSNRRWYWAVVWHNPYTMPPAGYEMYEAALRERPDYYGIRGDV